MKLYYALVLLAATIVNSATSIDNIPELYTESLKYIEFAKWVPVFFSKQRKNSVDFLYYCTIFQKSFGKSPDSLKTMDSAKNCNDAISLTKADAENIKELKTLDSRFDRNVEICRNTIQEYVGEETLWGVEINLLSTYLFACEDLLEKQYRDTFFDNLNSLRNELEAKMNAVRLKGGADHGDILGVPKLASQHEITQSYNNLKKLLQSLDNHYESTELEPMLINFYDKLEAAYDALSNQQNKKTHDIKKLYSDIRRLENNESYVEYRNWIPSFFKDESERILAFETSCGLFKDAYNTKSLKNMKLNYKKCNESLNNVKSDMQLIEVLWNYSDFTDAIEACRGPINEYNEEFYKDAKELFDQGWALCAKLIKVRKNLVEKVDGLKSKPAFSVDVRPELACYSAIWSALSVRRNVKQKLKEFDSKLRAIRASNADHYATLGIPKTASQNEIQSAFNTLNGKKEQRFKATIAHDVLGNEKKRQEYDVKHLYMQLDTNTKYLEFAEWAPKFFIDIWKTSDEFTENCQQFVSEYKESPESKEFCVKCNKALQEFHMKTEEKLKDPEFENAVETCNRLLTEYQDNARFCYGGVRTVDYKSTLEMCTNVLNSDTDALFYKNLHLKLKEFDGKLKATRAHVVKSQAHSDHYQTLSLKRGATKEEIINAYNTLRQHTIQRIRFHKSTFVESKHREDAHKLVAALDTLSNEDTRQSYDYKILYDELGDSTHRNFLNWIPNFFDEMWKTKNDFDDCKVFIESFEESGGSASVSNYQLCKKALDKLKLHMEEIDELKEDPRFNDAVMTCRGSIDEYMVNAVKFYSGIDILDFDKVWETCGQLLDIENFNKRRVNPFYNKLNSLLQEFSEKLKAERPPMTISGITKKNKLVGTAAAIVIASALLYKQYAHAHVTKLFNGVQNKVVSMFKNTEKIRKENKKRYSLYRSMT